MAAIEFKTCPICGHDLVRYLICAVPKTYAVECHYCGWGQSLAGNSYIPNDRYSYNPIQTNNFGFQSDPCANCSNNPKNGGSGICLCTLGLPEIKC